MKGGSSANEKALEQLFFDMEHVQLCVFKPRGWEHAALDGRVAIGELVRPMPGIYARASYWRDLSREERTMHIIRTLGITHRTWVFSHSSAALLHGLDVPRPIMWPVHFTTTREGGGKATRFLRHHRVEELIAVNLRDVQATGLAQTVVDCACSYPFQHALAIADSALHQRLVNHEELFGALDAMKGRRGIKEARRIISLADPSPENGGESRVRALMIELGLPTPELQAPIPDPEHPNRIYRADFLFRPHNGLPVIFELDGLDKYQNIAMTNGADTVQVMADERQREAAITAHGYRIVRMGFKQAMNPTFLLRRLAVYGIVPERVGLERRG